MAAAGSHPHEDHAEGIPELLERFPPRAVGVAGIADPRSDLAAEAELIRASVPSPRERRVHAALLAIGRRDPSQLRALHDGVEFAYPGVRIHVRAPSVATYEAWRALEKPPLGRGANRVSVVLEVEFGASSIVLPGDLPHTEAGRELSLGGWTEVLGNHPHLSRHTAMKIPHHGSRSALHPGIIAASETPRPWMLTPFNSSGLPRSEDEDGLATLLAAESPLLMTGLSLSTSRQSARLVHALTRGEVRAQTERLRNGRTFGKNDARIMPGSALEPLDPVWCVALAKDGTAREIWAGRAALEVMRE